MFSKNNLSVTEFNWDLAAAQNNQTTLVLCLLLFLLSAILITSRSKILLIMRTLFSKRHFGLIQREGKVMEEKTLLLTLTFDILTVALGIVMFSSTYVPIFMHNLQDITKIGILFLILFAAYGLKILFNRLYTQLFELKKETSVINQYKFIFLTDFSIVLFPALIIIRYAGAKFIYFVLAGVLAMLVIVWFYRLMKINPPNVNKFHFFLYFCTLEILPWILTVKVAQLIS